MAVATTSPELFDLVQMWRIDVLIAAGYPADDALLLGGRGDVDLHTAAYLIQTGCPLETALRILL